MNYLAALYRDFWQSRIRFYYLGAIALIMLLWFFVPSGKDETRQNLPAADDLDTFIPVGFVLVPILIQNVESLDALIGSYAVVDLYSEFTPEAVAKNVKLVRSPRDPSQMAVLIPDSASKTLVKYGQKPFTVVVQNRASRLHWEDL